MNLSVDHPWALIAALGLGALAAAAVWFESRRRKARLERIGTMTILERLVPPAVLHATLGRRPVWLACSAVLAGIAFAGPRWGAPRGATESRGIDMVFAIDASLSMLAHDERPTRLERAKQEARRLRALSRGDRVGLIAFAGRSYILTPLTADDGALALFLENLDPSIVGQPGSSLASAIRQGVDLLGPAVGSDRALVVFTDGESFDERDAMLDAARRARDAGVVLILMGFGTEDGSTILIEEGSTIVEKTDEAGETVITRYDGSLLRDVAEAAEGTAVDAGATDKASHARAVLANLRAERREVDARRTIPIRYQWFLLPALALLFWDIIASGRHRRQAALGILALVAVSSPAGAQSGSLLQSAERAFAEGHPLSAARIWRRAVESGDREPRTLYNLGTAYLAADSLDTAIEVLERVVALRASSVRADALYNLGLAYLRRGLRGSGEVASGSLRSALRTYRSVLLEQPDDSTARWNYELALKKLESSSSSGGGGGGGQGGSTPPPPQGQGSLSDDQAAQLLDAAAREERDVRSRQRPPQRVTTGGRDW